MLLQMETLTYGHAEDVKALFRAYPFRAFQQRRQGIDPAKLADMLWEQLAAQIVDNDSDQIVALGATEATGVAGLTPNVKHSDAFGLCMGRVRPFVAYRLPAAGVETLLRSILHQAVRRGYEHLSCRLDAADLASIRAFESAGFRLVDGSLKLTRRLGEAPHEATPPPAPELSMGPPIDGELDRLAEIAVSSHETNYLYNDPALDREVARGLFGDWARRCCGGLARHCFVARAGDEPVAFVNYLGADALERHLGLRLTVLDFVCVARKWQGKGVGRWLMSQSLNEIGPRYGWVELRASVNNFPALSAYHQLGFEVISSDVILHGAPAD